MGDWAERSLSNRMCTLYTWFQCVEQVIFILQHLLFSITSSPVSSYTVSHLLCNSYTQSTHNFNVYSKNYINRGHFSQLPFMIKAFSPDSGLHCKSSTVQQLIIWSMHDFKCQLRGCNWSNNKGMEFTQKMKWEMYKWNASKLINDMNVLLHVYISQTAQRCD